MGCAALCAAIYHYFDALLNGFLKLYLSCICRHFYASIASALPHASPWLCPTHPIHPFNHSTMHPCTHAGKDRKELNAGDTILIRMSQWPIPTVCSKDPSRDWFQVGGCARYLTENICVDSVMYVSRWSIAR